MPLSHVIYLDCRHSVRFTPPIPQQGDDVWCVKCQDMVRVRASLKPWRARCAVCSRCNVHADDEDTVRHEAIRHAKEAHHRVWVWGTGTTTHYLVGEDALSRHADAARINPSGTVPQGTLER